MPRLLQELPVQVQAQAPLPPPEAEWALQERGELPLPQRADRPQTRVRPWRRMPELQLERVPPPESERALPEQVELPQLQPKCRWPWHRNRVRPQQVPLLLQVQEWKSQQARAPVPLLGPVPELEQRPRPVQALELEQRALAQRESEPESVQMQELQPSLL